MKIVLSIEELAQLALAMIGLYYQPVSMPWWLWPVLFLSPDISMLGYLFGPRIGALAYNIFHHKAVAVAVLLAGYFSGIPYMLLAGLLLYAHSSFDRIMGYGLKYATGFKHTHLGEL